MGKLVTRIQNKRLNIMQLTFLPPMILAGLIVFNIILILLPSGLQLQLQPVELQLPSYTADDVLWWVEKVGIFSIFITLLLFWAQHRNDQRNAQIEKAKEIRDAKEIRRRACATMLRELEDHIDAFVPGRYTPMKSGEGEFINTYFNSDAYHSLIYSGLFTHFEEDTQIKLDSLYIEIASQNDEIKYRSQFRDSYFLHDKTSMVSENWDKAIERHENRITRRQKRILPWTEALIIRVRKEMEENIERKEAT